MLPETCSGLFNEAAFSVRNLRLFGGAWTVNEARRSYACDRIIVNRIHTSYFPIFHKYNGNFAPMSINQLTVSDEYTCHEEVTVVCITTNPVGNKIKK